MSREAPACRKALNDATRRWPNRDRRSDGIMGDARHQATKSDHNLGNAVDVTHDPSVGCDGALIAALAQRDPRVTYVIFNRRIWSKARAAEGWRPYHGVNPHNHHCHISIKAGSRDDLRDWAWVSASSSAVPGAPTPQGEGHPAAPTPQVPKAPPTKVTHVEPYPGIELWRGVRGLFVRRVQEHLVVLR